MHFPYNKVFVKYQPQGGRFNPNLPPLRTPLATTQMGDRKYIWIYSVNNYSKLCVELFLLSSWEPPA